MKPITAPTARLPLEADDEAAIRAVVQDVEDGFNANDPELLSRHFAGDATVVAAFGQMLDGRPAIEDANRAGVASPFLRDAAAHYRVPSVTFLTRDVALARKLAWSTEADASAGRSPEIVALYVFVRLDERWWIAARQNTLVVDGE